MENQQPIKQKDLQYFKDTQARAFRFRDWDHFYAEAISGTKPHVIVMLADRAAERYAAYREQQAKHAGFTLEELKKAISMAQTYKPSPIPGNFSACGLYTEKEIIDVLRPYKPREKGGEDEH